MSNFQTLLDELKSNADKLEKEIDALPEWDDVTYIYLNDKLNEMNQEILRAENWLKDIMKGGR